MAGAPVSGPRRYPGGVSAARSCALCNAEDWTPSWEKGGLRYVRCSSCGFVVADLTPARFERLNEVTFDGLLDHYVERSYEPRRQARYARRLARLERHVGTGRLLEVGSNVGGFLHAARERGWRAVGVEPVGACARYAREERGLDVRTGSIESVSLEAGAYDAAYAHAVLEHLTDPVGALRVVAQALRPGGVCWLDTVNAASYSAARLGPRWKLIDPALHYCLWTPRTLRLACQRAGLEVTLLRSHGVRLQPSAAGRPRGLARGLDEVRKLPLSAAARLTLRGESIAILARRPVQQVRPEVAAPTVAAAS